MSLGSFWSGQEWRPQGLVEQTRLAQEGFFSAYRDAVLPRYRA